MTMLKNRLLAGNMFAIFVLAYALLSQPGLAAPITPAAALTTQFVYEGRLSNLTGTYDFQFRLFDAASGGGLVGSPNIMMVGDTAVVQGEYQAVLDFGSAAFAGDARFLEVGYRSGTSNGAYSIQGIRKPILPTAYALGLRPGAQITGSSATGSAVLTGSNTGTGVGVWGKSVANAAVFGQSTNSTGVLGEGAVAGVRGRATGGGVGVRGDATSNAAVYGLSTNSTGVFGEGGFIGVRGRATGSGTGVRGDATTGNGTVGESRDGKGLYGVSTNDEGVRGESRNVNHGGVVGVNTAGGTAVYGTSSGIGVQGEGTNNSGVAGKSQNWVGVYGESVNGSGVSGVTGSPTGVGIYGGNNGGGYAMQAAGNTTQHLNAGGWVKAMALIGPNGVVKQCFNSQLPSTQAAVAPCGITAQRTNVGNYKVNFGFQIDNRFILVTPFMSSGTDHITANLAPVSSTQVEIRTRYSWRDPEEYQDHADATFYVIVY